MTKTIFHKQLGMLSVLVAVGIFAIHQTDVFAPHQVLSWISWALYIVFCLGIFRLGLNSTQSTNKSLFGQIFLVGTFFKMLLSILVIVAYAIITKPTDLFFVFPFFVIYTVYTVYEVYFMTKLAKQ